MGTNAYSTPSYDKDMGTPPPPLLSFPSLPSQILQSKKLICQKIIMRSEKSNRLTLGLSSALFCEINFPYLHCNAEFDPLDFVIKYDFIIPF